MIQRPKYFQLFTLFGLILASSYARAQTGIQSEDSESKPDRGTPNDAGKHGGIPKGFIVIEGDIIVPDGFLAIRSTYATNLWPAGVVPFEFDANVPFINQQHMVNAMAEWEAVANVDFRQRRFGDLNYIHIQTSTVNNSMVGMVGGAQIVNISTSGFGQHFLMCHELAHALGWWHEQSRVDRDGFIQVNYGNIESGQAHNFDIRPNVGPFGSGEYGPYDFDSVMHYSACAFSVCPDCHYSNPVCRTITVLPPNQSWQNMIGQQDNLSIMDTMTMSFMYRQPNWRFVDLNYNGTQTGSFFQPYKQFTVGVANTPSGGTLWVQPGNYSAIGTYSTPMTIRAPLGSVTLGD